MVITKTEPVSAASSTASHSIKTEKIFNMRDLGGYQTRSGRTIKPGLIYRSGELTYATNNDLNMLNKRGLSQIIDFRYVEDAKYAADKVPSGAVDTLVQIRKGGGSKQRASNRKAKFSKVDKSTFQARFAGAQGPASQDYTNGLVFNSYCQNSYKKYFNMLLANTDGKPVLFHCVAGKDRTGVAAVMTLLVLGVDEETAINEYAATNEFYKSVGSSKYGTSKGVYPSHIRAALTKVKKNYGSYNNFFEKVYGLNAEKRQKLRDIYLTPAEEPLRTCTRLYGNTRYDTSLDIARQLKPVNDDTGAKQQFETVVLASGANYPDALSGSCLAIRNNAPLLIIDSKNPTKVTDYISRNLTKSSTDDVGGKVYVLGGPGAVSDEVVKTLQDNGFDVQRLSGETRYDTNMAILNEIHQDNDELFICNGEGYADSLSASATGIPVLLVDPKTGITSEQKDFITERKVSHFYIAGGASAISSEIEHSLMQLGNVTRFSGKDRYATSEAIANYFSADAPRENVVLTYGENFPDGLCAGPLAYKKNAMLLLVRNSKISSAKNYCTNNHVLKGLVIGGSSVIADESAATIMRCDEVTK